MRSVLLVSLIAFVAGCSSSTAPGPIAGTWTQLNMFPGSSTTMTLRTTGTAIVGSGDWCGELLPCGKLSVSGFADDSGIHLVIRFDNGSRQFFDGRLVSSDSLVGSAKWEMGIPESFEVRFKRN
jgi:hypothetical protein